MSLLTSAARVLSTGLLLVLAGCVTVGPDYTPPELALPDAWHAAAVEGLQTGEANLQTWWTGLGGSLSNSPQTSSEVEPSRSLIRRITR